MQPNSYTLHTGCCQQFKRRLSQRLSDARQRRKNTSASREPETPALNPSSMAPVGNTSRTWGKKRKPSWIDDDNLDVDIVNVPPVSGAVGLGTAELPSLTLVRIPNGIYSPRVYLISL